MCLQTYRNAYITLFICFLPISHERHFDVSHAMSLCMSMLTPSFTNTLEFTSSPEPAFMSRLLQHVFPLFWTLLIIQPLFSCSHIFHGTSCYSLHVFFCFFHNVEECHVCVFFFNTCFNFDTCRMNSTFMCFLFATFFIIISCHLIFLLLCVFFFQQGSPNFHVF